MVTVVIGLMGWRLNAIRADRAKIEAKQIHLIRTSEKILRLTKQAQEQLLRVLDETRPSAKETNAVDGLSALIRQSINRRVTPDN